MGFLALSGLFYSRMLLDPVHRVPYADGGDRAVFAWFLSYVPWALRHHHDPLFSTLLNYPAGVSVPWNTSMPLLGVLLSPVTAALGPNATLNLITVLAPALSAFTAWLLLRRLAGDWPAGAGAVLYGFGPALLAQNIAHPNLSFAVLPPLIVLKVVHLLESGRARPRGDAIQLGGLVAGQLLLGEELLLLTFVSLVVWLSACAVAFPSRARAAVWRLVGASGWVLGTAVALAGPLLYAQLLGEHRLAGPAQEGANRVFVGRPLDLVRPTGLVWLSPAEDFGVRADVNGSEQGGYLGVALLLLLAAAVWWWRRRPLVWSLAATFMVVEVLSWGPEATFGGAPRAILPWRALSRLPLFDSLLPIRFCLPAALLAGALLALALAHVCSSSARLARLGVAPALALVALVPLVPRALPVGTVFERPDCLRLPLARQIASGEPTLVLPYTTPEQPLTQEWHAEARFPFPLVGGYAIHAAPGGRRPTLQRLDRVSLAITGFDTEGPSKPAARKLAGALGRAHVTRVLVLPWALDSPVARALAVDLGLRPQPVGSCLLYELGGASRLGRG